MDFLFFPFITMIALSASPEAKVATNNDATSPVNTTIIKQDQNDQEDRISVYRNGEVVDFTKYMGIDAKILGEIDQAAIVAAAYAGNEHTKNIKDVRGMYGDAFAAITFSNNEKLLDGDLISYNLNTCIDPKQNIHGMNGFPSSGDLKIPTKANGASKALVASVYKVENIKANGGLCWYASVKRDLVTIGTLKEPVKFDPKKDAAELVIVPVK